MAFYNEQEDEDGQEQGGGEQIGASSGVIGSGGSGAPGGAKATNAPDSPGNFVGIKQYLDANKNQSGKLGTQVAGQISNATNQAAQSINDAGDQFNQQANTTDYGQEKQKAFGTLEKAGGNISNDEYNQFKGARTAQYTGPQDITKVDKYQPAVANIQKAQQSADLSKSESGQQQLLSNIYSTPTYSSGEKRLDSYLLNSDENRGKLASASAPVQGLQGQLDQKNQQSKSIVEQRAQEAEGLRKSIAEALGVFDNPATPENEAAGAMGNYQNDITNQLGQKQADMELFKGRAEGRALGSEEAQGFGINQNDRMMGQQYSPFFNYGTPSIAGVTDPEERAKYNALLKLSGADETGENPLYGGAVESDFGNYKPSFDRAGWEQQLTNANNDYGQYTRDLLGGINQGKGNFALDPLAGSNYGDMQSALMGINAGMSAPLGVGQSEADRQAYSQWAQSQIQSAQDLQKKYELADYQLANADGGFRNRRR